MKLLAFDLDGTAFLPVSSVITDRLREALGKAVDKGIHIVPSTGRMKNFLPDSIRGLRGVRYVVTANGAGVYDLVQDVKLYENLVETETAVRVQQILNEYPVFVEYYNGGNAFLQKGMRDRAQEHYRIPPDRMRFLEKKYTMIDEYIPFLRKEQLKPEKINMPFVPAEYYDEIWNRLSGMEELLLTSSIPGNIEINRASCTKGAALHALATHLGIDRSEMMAVGDGGNDVAMLEYAGVSVAMGNAIPEAKQAAKFVTDTNEEDGLAKAVERFLL